MKMTSPRIPLEKIISRQIGLRQSIDRAHGSLATAVRHYPSISISRETGSGVEEITAELESILG